MLTTHFVTNDPISDDVLNTGLQTAYHDVGAGEAFVLVHGFTGSKLDFHDQLTWFADTHRVIAFDQRGHGESSNIGPYTLYTLAADLISLLDRLEIKQCHVLGHSLGGMVVLRALLANPERFHSALLMDTAPYAMSLYDNKLRSRLDAMVLEQGCEVLLKGMQGQPQNEAVQRGINYLGEQEHWRRIRVKLSQMDPAAFTALGKAISDQPSVLGNLSTLATPTTVLVGKHDKPFVKPAKEMASALPNSTLVLLDDAGHSPQYENADAWRAAIETHLATAGP
jgi:pimeloyl-ACP methyl ester carboxylesterase